MGRKVLLFGLVLAGLFVAGVVYAQFYAPTVEVSTETPLTEGAGGGTAAIIAGVNESEVPEWWHWSEEDWQKFQWYANQTEIKWTYSSEGEKIGGKVIVAGEPLFKEYDKYSNYGLTKDLSPVGYLSDERKGNCVNVPRITYYLFRAKGEELVKLTKAKNINYSTDSEYVGLQHSWVEWTDNENSKWIINYNTVVSLQQWYKEYNWTVNWEQYVPDNDIL